MNFIFPQLASHFHQILEIILIVRELSLTLVGLRSCGLCILPCREDLAKNINADEAAAMGAVYQAAALSKAFKVKPFLVRDAAVFPIQVSSFTASFVLWLC